MELTEFPFKKKVLFIGHFFGEPRVINFFHVLDEHFFDGLFAGFFCNFCHGSEV